MKYQEGRTPRSLSLFPLCGAKTRTVPASLPNDEALRAFQTDQRPLRARWQGLSTEEISIYPSADEQKTASFKTALSSKVALYLNEIGIL